MCQLFLNVDQLELAKKELTYKQLDVEKLTSENRQI